MAHRCQSLSPQGRLGKNTVMGPRHISEILPEVIEDICDAATLARGPWRTHTDAQLGIVPEDDMTPAPTAPPRPAAAPAQPAAAPSDDVLTTAEVAAICRAHFQALGGSKAAAAHYGLSLGRLSQIQTGIDVSCPRVLKELGIVRERSGRFMRAIS